MPLLPQRPSRPKLLTWPKREQALLRRALWKCWRPLAAVISSRRYQKYYQAFRRRPDARCHLPLPAGQREAPAAAGQRPCHGKLVCISVGSFFVMPRGESRHAATGRARSRRAAGTEEQGPLGALAGPTLPEASGHASCASGRPAPKDRRYWGVAGSTGCALGTEPLAAGLSAYPPPAQGTTHLPPSYGPCMASRGHVLLTALCCDLQHVASAAAHA